MVVETTTDSTGKSRRQRVVDWLLGFHGTPDQVARGMALGVFLAFTPLLGLQMLLAVILATLTYSNRPAAVAAVWITNPFTALPVYLMTYRIGRYFTPGYGNLDIRRRLTAVVVDEQGEWLNLARQLREITSLGAEILVPMFIGGFVVGLGLAIVSYILTRSTIKYAKQRLSKHPVGNQPQ